MDCHADKPSMTGSGMIWTTLFFRHNYLTLQDEVQQRLE